MKTQLALLIFLSALLGGDFAGIAQADTIDVRASEIVRNHINYPYPDPDDPEVDRKMQGRIAFAFAALYNNEQVSRANSYITWLYDNGYIPHDDQISFDGYFALPIFVRIYVMPESRDRLTAQNRQYMEEMLWRLIDKRSLIERIQQPRHAFHTENLQAMGYSSYYLAAQALAELESPYGPSVVLNDGYTLQTHIDAWVDHWCVEASVRGDAGINLEVMAPAYEEYTMASYYNVRDFAQDATLRQLMDNLITLYWADVAHEFMPCGYRGGGGMRMYDGILNLSLNYWAYSWLYMYTWHNNGLSAYTHGVLLCGATSDYRIPQAITVMARTPKTSYEYRSRRWGRRDFGGNTYLEPSYILRTTSACELYAMGAIAYDHELNWNSYECRFASVMHHGDVNDRIVITADGAAKDGEVADWRGVSGFCSQDVMVTALAPNYSEVAGMWVYLGREFGVNREDDSGWVFTYADGTRGTTYAAIRVATGGYTAADGDQGVFMVLGDMMSPVVIQMGRDSDYSSYDNFKTSVKANAFSYDPGTGEMAYVSERGQEFKLWRDSYNYPWLDGAPIDMNPAYTYDSPYLSGNHGDYTATFSYPGYDDVVLDFSYDNCGAWGYLPNDLNQDCWVDLQDFSILAQEWMTCTRVNEPGCAPVN